MFQTASWWQIHLKRPSQTLKTSNQSSLSRQNNIYQGRPIKPSRRWWWPTEKVAIKATTRRSLCLTKQKTTICNRWRKSKKSDMNRSTWSTKLHIAYSLRRTWPLNQRQMGRLPSKTRPQTCWLQWTQATVALRVNLRRGEACAVKTPTIRSDPQVLLKSGRLIIVPQWSLSESITTCMS